MIKENYNKVPSLLSQFHPQLLISGWIEVEFNSNLDETLTSFTTQVRLMSYKCK